MIDSKYFTVKISSEKMYPKFLWLIFFSLNGNRTTTELQKCCIYNDAERMINKVVLQSWLYAVRTMIKHIESLHSFILYNASF